MIRWPSTIKWPEGRYGSFSAKVGLFEEAYSGLGQLSFDMQIVMINSPGIQLLIPLFFY